MGEIRKFHLVSQALARDLKGVSNEPGDIWETEIHSTEKNIRDKGPGLASQGKGLNFMAKAGCLISSLLTRAEENLKEHLPTYFLKCAPWNMVSENVLREKDHIHTTLPWQRCTANNGLVKIIG